ncbi:baseplate J protein [Paenibacillus selenitireducens]|uniref:Baseplate J protein n=1 Tax=Paenibacillus selenitireducens TaxID=1324314 RepID=A0A1T2X9N5_9BACL|nr:baseplate J/gp47 family protein [Paenibacillus selenitireducens]OPA76614.1 baseplate J protein [Paenibacillus selenitireducens]
MYEDKTFEAILDLMLARVPNDVDKREGSVIYNACAPAAWELAQMYMEMDVILHLAFASTSSGEYLTLRAAEMGVNRSMATKAQRKGIFYAAGEALIDVPIGTRFSINAVNYVVLSKIDTGQFILECETAGEAGNSPVGALLPIDYVSGLARAELTDILTEGINEESDEKLLTKYQLRVQQPSTSGNIYQYKQWAMAVQGVGDAKVFPLWDGPGSVKVVIVNSDKQPAGPALVAETVSYIEKVRPIGAAVKVVSGVGKAITVKATVTLASGYTLQSVSDGLKAALTDYLKSIAFEMSYVSYARIGTLLMGVPGVLDYSALSLNGGYINIALADEEIPVFGAVDLGV